MTIRRSAFALLFYNLEDGEPLYDSVTCGTQEMVQGMLCEKVGFYYLRNRRLKTKGAVCSTANSALCFDSITIEFFIIEKNNSFRSLL